MRPRLPSGHRYVSRPGVDGEPVLVEASDPPPSGRATLPGLAPPPRAPSDRPGGKAPAWLPAVLGPGGVAAIVLGLAQLARSEEADARARLAAEVRGVGTVVAELREEVRETRREVRELQSARMAEDAARRAREELVRSHLTGSRDPAARQALSVLGE